MLAQWLFAGNHNCTNAQHASISIILVYNTGGNTIKVYRPLDNRRPKELVNAKFLPAVKTNKRHILFDIKAAKTQGIYQETTSSFG